MIGSRPIVRPCLMKMTGSRPIVRPCLMRMTVIGSRPIVRPCLMRLMATILVIVTDGSVYGVKDYDQ